jgi:hypothetical protein
MPTTRDVVRVGRGARGSPYIVVVSEISLLQRRMSSVRRVGEDDVEWLAVPKCCALGEGRRSADVPRRSQALSGGGISAFIRETPA